MKICVFVNQYSGLLVEIASNRTLRHSVKIVVSLCSCCCCIWPYSSFKEDKAKRHRRIKILMVSAQFNNLFALFQRNAIPPFARNCLRRATTTSRKLDSREMKLFSESLRDTCAELFDISSSCCRVLLPEFWKTVTTCSRFIRALVAACDPGPW